MAWRPGEKRTQHDVISTKREPRRGSANHVKDFLRTRKRRTESAAGEQKVCGGAKQEPWPQTLPPEVIVPARHIPENCLY